MDGVCFKKVKNEEKRNWCPWCRHGINKETNEKFEAVRVSRAAISYFGSIVFKCSLGCEQTFKYNESKDHLVKCNMIPFVECLLLCGKADKLKGRQSMEDHLRIECPKMKLRCNNCLKLM